MTRRPMLMGNWKMFKTSREARAFADELTSSSAHITSQVDYVIFPPFTALQGFIDSKPAGVHVGAQNMYHEDKGAFTGEVSPLMLSDLGVEYVLVGHSERRHIFGESDELTGAKVQSAVQHGLVPVLCVGEDLPEREAGRTIDVVERQTCAGLALLSEVEVAKIVIAYEPVWAIGTGKTATAADAQEVILQIRAIVEKAKGPIAAQGVRILYGGSVKPDNIASLMSQPDIDGALVGGASLEADSYVAMARAISSPKAGV